MLKMRKLEKGVIDDDTVVSLVRVCLLFNLMLRDVVVMIVW